MKFIVIIEHLPSGKVLHSRRENLHQDDDFHDDVVLSVNALVNYSLKNNEDYLLHQEGQDVVVIPSSILKDCIISCRII